MWSFGNGEERCKKWWSKGEVEIIAKNEVLSGFQISVSFEWVMQDKPVWTIFEETKNASDKVLVTQLRLLEPAMERGDSVMTTFLMSPPPEFSFVDSALGRVLIAPIPPMPKVTSKRNTRHLSMRYSDYRIPLPDGDFDKHENSIMAQASLISYYRHLSSAGGFISEDTVALSLTKDTFSSTFNLASEGSSSLSEIVFDFQLRIQNALLVLGLFKPKKADGRFDSTFPSVLKQFQHDFNHKPDHIRSLALNCYFKSTTTDSPTESPSQSNDLQVRTDGLLEPKTVAALFGYILELKQNLELFGFPTPSDPLKSPKRFKALFKAILEAMDTKSGDTSPNLAAVPSFLDELAVAHRLLQSHPKAISPTSKESLDKLMAVSSQYKPKEKKRSRRQSTGPFHPIPTRLQTASSSIDIPSHSSPQLSHALGNQPQTDGSNSRNSAKDDSFLTGSPKSPARSLIMSFGSSDSPRRSATSPRLNIMGNLGEVSTGKAIHENPILEAPVLDLVDFLVFDREYHESVPNWEREIEIVNPLVSIVGWQLYMDPVLVLDRTKPAYVVVKGESNQVVSGMLIRRRKNVKEECGLWNYYAADLNGPLSQVVRVDEGSMVVESLSESQIAERRLVKCGDGCLNPHVSILRIQSTLVKLGCQAKDFEFSLTSANLRSQDQLYLKYKLDRSLPIDDALYMIVRNIQVSLVALCCMPLSHVSPWYSNFVIDGMLQFQRDYTTSCVDGKPLVWAAGHITFSIYEELIHQANLFHKALIDLGFPVRCSPFEDPVQFHTYAIAYRESQSQLSEALHIADLPTSPDDTEPIKSSSTLSGDATSKDHRVSPQQERKIIPEEPSKPPFFLSSTTIDHTHTSPLSSNDTSSAKTTPLSPLQARRVHAMLSQPSSPVPRPITMATSSPGLSAPLIGPNAVSQLHRSYAHAHFTANVSSLNPATTNGHVNAPGHSAPGLATPSPLRVDIASSPPTPAALMLQLSPTMNAPSQPNWGTESDLGAIQEIEFGSSLATKYKEALEHHKELQLRYQELEESFLELSNDAAEANTSLQFFEEQYKESVQNYDALLREYDSVKRTVAENEDAMQGLVQVVATLDAKLQKLQRMTQRSFTTQLLWYLILLLLYVLLLPAIGITFLIDLYRARYRSLVLSDENSLRTRLQRYAKLQLTKLERVIGDIERKVMKVTGLDAKDKRA